MKPFSPKASSDKSQSRARPPIEQEATLIVCSDAPWKVLERIARVPAIGPYELADAGKLQMRDVYLDTPDGALRTHRWALRVREIASKKWITLKGQARVTTWGASQRIEIEREFSPDAVEALAEALEPYGIVVEYGEVVNALSQTEDPMTGRALKKVQQRSTVRILKNVLRAGSNIPPLAEMALDSVTYHFRQGPVRHYEVEVETKSAGGEEAARIIIAELRLTFGSVLRPWTHDKLVTGRAIEQLLSDGSLEGHVIDGDLAPAAYRLIEKLL